MVGIIEDEAVEVPVPLGEIIPPQEQCTALFVPNGLDKIITRIRAIVEAHHRDASTEKGRKELASLARKVASSKTLLESYGKDLSAAIKVQATGIDSERKRMREALDALRDQARKPLTDYEEQQASRIAGHEAALQEVLELSNVPFGASVSDIEARLVKLDEYALRNWEEFAQRFSTANDASTLRLRKVLDLQKEADAQQAAFLKSDAERVEREKRESAERVEREQKERDGRIAKEATERAEWEAKRREEATAKAAQAAQDRAEAAEKAAAAAVEKAERDRIAAAEQAKRDQEVAVAAERQRAEDAKRKEADAVAKREANTRHVAKINREVIDALVDQTPGMNQDLAMLIVNAIAEGKIPHTKVSY